MLVILARSARYMKLLPFSSDNARSGTRRGALAESSRAGRTGREGFVAGFRKAYCGGPSATLHTRIPVGQGICGAAVTEKATIVVPDVNDDPRYLQCFINTRAEIVVPILRDGAAIAEIDIDSDQANSFTPTDKDFLEWVATELVRIL